MDSSDPILRHYQGIREEERITSGLGQLEFIRVQEILRRHLPPSPARILDVGGATGVHAGWLADEGYEVRIIDVTPRHVETANAVLGSKGVVAEIGDARSLPAEDRCVDAVLLFGPLYHLTERRERLRALREARRVVRPGGMVGVAAINRFASLFDGLARGFLFDPEFLPIVRQDLLDGQHRNPTSRPEWFTTAFFHHPDELRAEVVEGGLEVVELVGIEGLAGWLPQLTDGLREPEGRDLILWSAQCVEAEPALAGLSAHLLLTASAPAESV
jgi:SAM-dependent methyltransferase